MSIIRYHLSAQKQSNGRTSPTMAAAVAAYTATAPSPPARENVPRSFIDTPSAVSTMPSTGGGGSDPNLSRFHPAHMFSMRRQLLRRVWSKECRRYDRTSSLSPPMRRPSRRMNLDTAPSPPEACKECERLEQEHRHSNEAIAAKQRKYSESPTTMMAHRIGRRHVPSSLATATQMSTSDDGQRTANISIASSRLIASSNLDRAAISTATSVTSSIAPPSSVGSLDEVVSAPVAPCHNNIDAMQQQQDNVYYVEIDDDQIHITTASSTTPTTATETSDGGAGGASGASGARRTYYASTHMAKRSTAGTVDENDNNVRDDAKMPARKSSEENDYASIADMSMMDQNANVDSIKSDNNTIPVDGIDTYVANVLIDSLNNVIVTADENERKHQKPSLIKSKTHSIDDTIDGNGNCTATSTDAPFDSYFPQYTGIDSPDNNSECSAKYSNTTDGFELPQNYLIALNPGSNYPGYAENGRSVMVVRRLAQLPRTESLEVQPSSASTPDDENRIDSDDESVSLVDSLDEPKAIATDCSLSDRPCERSAEAFYVPMPDGDHDTMVDEKLSPRVETSIASSMPTKLRDRLEKRHLDMHQKRKDEVERKRDEVLAEKQQRRRKFGRIEQTASTPATSVTLGPVSSTQPAVPIALKSKGRFLRSEIGLLESYTIDAKGNLQFRAQPSTMSTTTTTVRSIRKTQQADSSGKRNIVQHTVMKKVSAHKPAAQSRKKEMIKRKPLKALAKPNRLSAPSGSSSNGGGIPSTSVASKPNDLQQMTLYHQSHSDMITPDADCGPRRMYQKTEIHDGEKRIEILEIVECLNSSPESLATTPISGGTASASSSAVTASLPSKHTKLSKIPVPVAALMTSAAASTASTRSREPTSAPTANRTRSRDAPSTQSSQLLRNLQSNSGNSSKVDQLIADLLIEALNHSAEFGIEFVKTPSTASSKRVKVSRRGGASVSTGTRSASSGKYQRIFDAIPEEKSGLSVDSSNEERSLPPPSSTAVPDSTVTSTVTSTVSTASTGVGAASQLDVTVTPAQSVAAAKAISNAVADGSTSTAKSSTSGSSTTNSTVSSVVMASTTATNVSPKTISTTAHSHLPQRPSATTSISTQSSQATVTTTSRGRAAIETDDMKTDAWFDCFGRSRTDTPTHEHRAPAIDEGIARYLNKTRLFA